MSFAIANNNRRVNKSSAVMSKPFCKVCFDTGKPESLYTSHFVRETRDVNSRVVCPTLLSLVCRFCGRNGHTVSKCKKIVNAPMKKNTDFNVVDRVNRALDIMTVKSNLTNIFDNLSSDDDDDDFSTAEISSVSVGDLETVSSCSVDDDVFPMLNSAFAKVPAVAWSGSKSYADILCTPCVIHEDNVPAYVSSDSNSLSSSVAAPRKIWFTKNWADYSDSDSDDD